MDRVQLSAFDPRLSIATKAIRTLLEREYLPNVLDEYAEWKASISCVQTPNNRWPNFSNRLKVIKVPKWKIASRSFYPSDRINTANSDNVTVRVVHKEQWKHYERIMKKTDLEAFRQG